MNFANKLKTKLRTISETSEPAYIITQSISLPLYELDLKGLVDSDSIKERCLSRLEKVSHNTKLVKEGWQSPYYVFGTTEFEIFNDLIKIVEDKLNLITDLQKSNTKSNTKYRIDHCWFVIYGEGTYHDWHTHNGKVDHFSGYSGVYYPAASDAAQPIEFENNDSTISIPVTKDKLILFPSVLKHRVPKCTDPDLRIAFSFNFSGWN